MLSRSETLLKMNEKNHTTVRSSYLFAYLLQTLYNLTNGFVCGFGQSIFWFYVIADVPPVKLTVDSPLSLSKQKSEGEVISTKV